MEDNKHSLHEENLTASEKAEPLEGQLGSVEAAQTGAEASAEKSDDAIDSSDQSLTDSPLLKPDLDDSEHEWFKIEQRIKVRTESGPEDELYETHVRDFTDNKIYLDIPKENGAFIVPAIGSKILANFIAKNNVYFFETFILSITKMYGIPVWVLEMPATFKKIQRRSFLRMDVLLPINVRVETQNGLFMPSVKTNCLDISGGGVRYVLDFPLSHGKMAKIKVDDFPGVGSMEAFCKAVRSVKSAVSEENYWIGAQFIDLPYKIEDKIVRHIFKVQKRILVSSSAE